MLWLRADLGITLNGSTVSAWGDQSGQGNGVSQGTPANQPTYVAATGGSPAALSFPGGGGATALQKATFNLAQPLEYFIAARSANSNPTAGQYLIDGGTNKNIVAQSAAGNVLNQFDGGTAGNGVTITIGSSFIVDSFYNGGSSQQTLNGGAAATGANPGTVASTSLTIGNSGGLTTNWGGLIFEVAAFVVPATGMAPADRVRMNRYMGASWGVVVP